MRAFALGLILTGCLGAQARFQWPEGRRVAVSFSFDDARESQVKAGLPLFAKHKTRVTFYVSPGALEKRLDLWRQAVREGHEIGNHSASHPCTGNFPWSQNNALEDYTLARMEEDMAAASRDIERLLGVRPLTFAYPCGAKFVGRGAAAQSSVPLVARLFLAGRGFRDEWPNDPEFFDFAQVLGIDSDGLSFAEMRAWVERAAPQRGWVVFAGHDIGPPGRQTTPAAALEQFLAWAAQSRPRRLGGACGQGCAVCEGAPIRSLPSAAGKQPALLHSGLSLTSGGRGCSSYFAPRALTRW
jgi:Predicted xylanase/chitin deacetylase